MTPHEQTHRADTLRDTVLRGVRSFYSLLGNRRKFARMPIRQAVVVTLKGAAVVRTERCLSVDVSLGGIGLESPEAIDVDATVELRSEEDGPRRLARVRYCRESGTGYRMGLEFLTNQRTPASPR